METFKVVLNSNYGQSVLTNLTQKIVVVVTSEPIHKYGKWYYKLLNKITFGNIFCEGWEHIVEKISE